MSANSTLLGRLVIATAGRDCDNIYVVVNCSDSRFVQVADGRSRSVKRPKTKNIKHLRILDSIAVSIEAKLVAGHLVGNEELRQALASLCTTDIRQEGRGGGSSCPNKT